MIDTHCHIDDEQYLGELDAVIARQQEAGVEAILVPGVTVDSCRTVLEVCGRYPGYLYPALGLHPEEVKADYQQHLDTIRQVMEQQMQCAAAEMRLIAVGEIGLDYHFSVEYKAEQQDAFRQQLRWAREWNLPVMVHARDAAEDTLYIIKEIASLQGTDLHPLRGVMHCFSGSYEVAREYVRLGWYLGIGGVITFKNCKLTDTLCPTDGRAPIPLSSLMLETDAPYMAPVPFRGRPNESRLMTYVVKKLSETYRVDEKEVILRTNSAAKALFLKK